MKIGKFFKFVIKTLTAAIAVGSIVYIVKDIMVKKLLIISMTLGMMI